MSKKLKFGIIAALSLLFIILMSCSGGDETGAPRITEHDTGDNYAGYCTLCHGPGAGPDEYPADHLGRTNDLCFSCHPK
jgi:predicted CXXCH cytochrome family protein